MVELWEVYKFDGTKYYPVKTFTSFGEAQNFCNSLKETHSFSYGIRQKHIV